MENTVNVTVNSSLYLYVFVNLEYDSMGRGRCAAQASHAANQFIDTHVVQILLENVEPQKDVMAWRKQANGFGTQIVKAARNEIELRSIVQRMIELDYVSDLVIDPEYVVQDGESYHVVKDVVTGAYVFGHKEGLFDLLKQYPLLQNDQVDRLVQFR